MATDYSIENCASVLKCPRHWQALMATDNPARRFCNTCDQTVHRCDDEDSLNRHLNAGDCVAVRAAEQTQESYYVGSKTGAGYDASSRVTNE